MAEDSFTEVTGQSWLGRLKDALAGIVFGLILLVGAFVVLFWNEGRAVERHKTLQEGASAVVSLAAPEVDPAREGDLVHVVGEAQTDEVLTDPTFGVETRALRFERQVEMYQWEEDEDRKTKKKTGGGTKTTTTYSYRKTWSETLIDSGSFERPDGHENPASMPWRTHRMTASRVTVGEIGLAEVLIQKIDRWRPVAVDSLETLPEELAARGRLDDGGLYFGTGEPDSPAIGDVRVRFRAVPPTEVSLIAEQAGGRLEPFEAEAGGTIALVELGRVEAEAMFEAAERRNTFLTWGLRLGGLLIMTFGFALILRPLSVAADLIPAVGSLVAVGTGLVSFLLAGFLSLVTISVAWVVYRPLLGGALLVAAAAAITLLVIKARRTEPAVAGEPPPPPPPAPPSSS